MSLQQGPVITASGTAQPPRWAVLQRNLFQVMEEAADLTIKTYCDSDGVPYFADDVDDLYERFYNWPLFYAMGASEHILNLAQQEYEAINLSNAHDSVNPHYPWLFPQLHNEYYSLQVPQGQSPSWIPGQRIITDWHHMGEGNQLFYGFGVADPLIEKHMDRSQRFAALMTGEDPHVKNYDHKLNQFRSVYTDGKDPIFEVNAEQAKGVLHGGSPTVAPWAPRPMGVRVSLYPVIKDLELDWWTRSSRAKEVVDAFNKIILLGDIPHNLAATALVTNAYLHTGDEKYKSWVVRYADGWLDRMRKNGGIMPDNIGPTGVIGEHREGQWWGGWYGWNCYKGMDIGLTSITIGAECAHLLTGDDSYLDLIRSQMHVLFENSKVDDKGQRLFSWRYGPDGWFDYKPMPIKWLPHLYHASLSTNDRQLMEQVRDGDVERDWGSVPRINAKSGGDWAFFHYHDGKFPDWPERLMESELTQAQEALDRVKSESRSSDEIISQNTGIPNPVSTESLTQMMFGAPGTVYNGGLLRATVRYFDADRKRAGLPDDVSALVDELGPNVVGVQLVNLGRESRRVSVQSGAFGEHEFTELTYQDPDGQKTVAVNSKYFEVVLPPSTEVGIKCRLNRYVNSPAYAFPWHS